jgi:hypothetical protein
MAEPQEPKPASAVQPESRVFNYFLAVGIAVTFALGAMSSGGVFGGEERAEALHLRDEAASRAREGHWAESLEALDEAKQKDPHGDDDKLVTLLRDLDLEKISGAGEHPSPHAPTERPSTHEEPKGEPATEGHSGEKPPHGETK